MSHTWSSLISFIVWACAYTGLLVAIGLYMVNQNKLWQKLEAEISSLEFWAQFLAELFLSNLVLTGKK